MNTNLQLVLLSLSALMSIVISIYFLMFAKPSKLLNSFIYFQVLIIIWCTGYIVELLSSDLSIKWQALCVENLSISFIGFAWLLCCMTYTRNKFIEKRKGIFILSVIPIINYLVLFTNPYHGLYYKAIEITSREYGIFFWINIFCTYIYVCLGTFLVIKYSLKTIGDEKKQSILLITAVITPLVSNMLYVTRTLKLNFDITPISFSVSLLLFAIATFKYRFLNAMPQVFKKVYETVGEAILFIDNEGVIISRNSSFEKIFGEFKGNNSKELISFFKSRTLFSVDQWRLFKAINNKVENTIFGEVQFNFSKNKIFKVVVQPVEDSRKRNIGKVISFIDITSYKELTDELDKKNEELIEANKQLRQHMLIVEELAAAKERNRMAREVHDTLGHTLTLLVKMQEAAIFDFEHDNKKSLETIKKSNEITREGLKDLRISLYNMMPDMVGSDKLIDNLKRLTSNFSNLGVEIDISFDGDPSFDDKVYSQTIIRICQEAITNSIKHGNANEIHIILRINEKSINVYIIDNGKGCSEINKGYGLSGMEERVKPLGGSIIFGSDGESGFNIHVELPRSEK